MGSFKPCLNILPAAQQNLWPQLRAAYQLGLVLYGGTAIALRLGHRCSVDFDFFTSEPLNKEALRSMFPFMRHATVLQDEKNTYTVSVAGAGEQAGAVKVSFFGGIDFGRVGDPEVTADGVLQVASLDDLMATKLKVIFQRIEAKDYLDIVAMLRAGVSLREGLAAAREMYGPAFQPSECLKALTYFSGGDLDMLPRGDKDTLMEAAGAVRDLPKVEIVARELAVRLPNVRNGDNDPEGALKP